MKKISVMCVAVLAMAFAFSMSAKAQEKKALYDGYFGVKAGYMTGSFDTDANVSVDANGLMLGVDYNIPAEKGNHRISLFYAPLSGSEVILGTNVDFDIKYYQLSYNRLWDFGVAKEMTGSFYGGVGLGYGHANADYTVLGVSGSDSSSSLDFNAIVGYKLPSNWQIEALWVVDESTIGLNVGYNFK